MGSSARHLPTSLFALSVASACGILLSALFAACAGKVAGVPDRSPGPDDDASTEAAAFVPPVDESGTRGDAPSPASPADATAPGAPAIVGEIYGEPHEMRVDSSGVYVSASDPLSTPPLDSLYVVPLAGGAPPVKLAHDEFLESIALDADAVYVTAGPTVPNGASRVLRVPKGGGNVLELTTACDQGRMLEAVAVDATSVYVGCGDGEVSDGSAWPTETPGFIARMPKTGGPAETVLAEVYQVSSLVVADDVLYYAEQLGGSVGSCPVSGCNGAPTTRAPRQWHPRRMTRVGSSLVWGCGWGTDHTFSWSMPLDGGSPTQLCQDDWFRYFDADESGVYWNLPTGQGPDFTATLWRANLDGSNPRALQTVPASATSFAGPIALAADAVYHVGSDGQASHIWRLPK
jgi:hypothetical protein